MDNVNNTDRSNKFIKFKNPAVIVLNKAILKSIEGYDNNVYILISVIDTIDVNTIEEMYKINNITYTEDFGNIYAKVLKLGRMFKYDYIKVDDIPSSFSNLIKGGQMKIELMINGIWIQNDKKRYRYVMKSITQYTNA
mgnify:CR=1 FL=1|tara:strand:- start:503 stop:916 length:414 start_codon:yes stop_codon:yes gene_type:complete